jgi:type II secretory pathway pseudopilin PulG
MCAERLIQRARRASAERGLTLSELMIAMGLTGVVAVMLLASAQVQTGLSRQASQTQYVQDNVRSAMEEIVQNVRRAGKSFITKSAVNAVPPSNPQRLQAVSIVNAAGGANTPDALNLILIDDSVTGTLMQDASQFTNPLYVNNSLGMARGAMFTLSNFNSAVLYSLTLDPGAAALSGIGVAALTITPPPVPPASTLFRGSIINRASLLSYRVDTTIIPGTPVLVLQDGAPLDMTQPAQIVAENIEDLQFALGVDGLFTGVSDGRIAETGKAPNDDEWINNYPGEVTPAVLPAGSVVAALRITVIGRTATAGDQLAPGRPAAEDRAAGGQDYFRRRVLTTQVALRAMATN